MTAELRRNAFGLPGAAVRRWAPVAAVAGLMLAGAALRWIGLQQRGLWLDEIGHAVTASLPPLALLESVRSQAAAAPLDLFAVKLVTEVAGSSTTTTVRLWAFLAGVIAIPVAYEASRRLARSAWAGVASASIIALSPFAVLYSREARPYSLAVLLTLLIIATYAWAAARPARSVRWVILGVVIALGCLTHYYVPLVAVAIGLADVTARIIKPATRQRMIARGHARAAFVVGIMVLPWAIWALPEQLGRRFFWEVPALSAHLWWETVATTLVAGVPRDTASAATPIAVIVLSALAFVVRRTPAVAGLGFLAALLIPLTLLLATRSGYQFSPRQVITLLPILAVLAGIGLSVVRAFALRAISPTVVAGVVLVFVVLWMAATAQPLQAVLSRSGQPSEDWPAAARFTGSALCPGARVLTNVGEGAAYGIGFYDPTLRPQARVLAVGPGESIADAVARDALPRDWVMLLAYAGGMDSPNVQGLGQLRQWFARRGWTERQFGDQLYVYFRDVCPPERPSP